MSKPRQWRVPESERQLTPLKLRVAADTAIEAVNLADVIHEATASFLVLVQLWNGELCVSRSTSIRSIPVLHRLLRHVSRMAVSDVYTLFDRFGTDLRESIERLAVALGSDLGAFFDSEIDARWERVRSSVAAIRGNAGHHFPSHEQGLDHASQQLAHIPAGDIAELALALHSLAAALFCRSVDIPGVDAAHPEWQPARSFAVAIQGLPKINPPLGAIRPSLPVNGLKPAVYFVKHLTLEVPSRLFAPWFGPQNGGNSTRRFACATG